MHNLYLGTGKHVFKIWLKQEIINNNDLFKINDLASQFTCPAGVGRIPSKVSSNYGSFNAAQWKTWITVYSAVVLKSILPQNHYVCWVLFVGACCLIGQRVSKKTNVDTADALLKKFCTKFEELYGAENCTPNLHLHLHLKDCLMDFGTPHAFWCFAFERCNGILGSLQTNNKSIEIRVMKKFLMGQQLRIMSGSIDAAMKVLLPIKEVDIDFVSCNNNAAPEIEECAHRFVWSPLEDLKFFDMQHLKFLPPV